MSQANQSLNNMQALQDQSPPSGSDSPYPEQRHAGKVGYGPMYHQGPTFHDKIKGLEEEIKGKITKRPELVERGKKRMSGILKREEREKDLKDENSTKKK